MRLAPGVSQYHYNLAVLLQQTGQSDAAMLEYAATLRLEPRHSGALWNQANLLRADERFDAALALLERLAAIQPDYPGLALATAVSLYGLRRLDDAMAWFGRANAGADASENARDPLVAWEMAHCVLSTGDWARGFDLYERRFEAGERTGVRCYPFPFPRWRGESLAGRSILIHGEQGLGDEIMFANTLPDLQAAVGPEGRLLLAFDRRLVPLMARSYPAATAGTYLVAQHNAKDLRLVPWAGKPDYVMPLGSALPVLRQDLAAFPGAEVVEFVPSKS